MHRLYYLPISRFAAVLLVALAIAIPAFCGEIHDAAKAGDLAKARALLKSHPDLVFSKDEDYGMTPLHLASCYDHKDVAELLLANKADANAKSNEHSTGGQFQGSVTPLHLAAENGYRDVAVLLLANKADVNAKNKDGWTPLHEAAAMGNKDVVELLLANKAEVNAKCNYGYTPLHEAAEGNEAPDKKGLGSAGHKDVVKLLLDHGADVNAKNKSGSTPLNLAVFSANFYDNRATVALLRQYGGHE
jgi:ankyrin repeat protein